MGRRRLDERRRLRVERYLLTLRRHGHQPQLEDSAMTTNTEALRAQFERRMNLRGWSEANIRRDGLDYSSTQITEAWHAFQAGHAAAKAETAAAVAKERERAATVVDEKIGSVCKANPGRGGRINSAVAFVLDALRDCADAIRAGAKEPSDA